MRRRALAPPVARPPRSPWPSAGVRAGGCPGVSERRGARRPGPRRRPDPGFARGLPASPLLSAG